ncbi:GrpB domain protein [Talaromyces pinophilus]|uniref:GrpB domain protein n=1 Tax=Talaromyces pinophilus TaxID=128442 RepID=A0A478EC47_TALPI|nr:GrpB domain protein [Talaromyces pinophilus]
MSTASESTPLKRRRSLIEQISHRLDKPIAIIEYDPIWANQFSIVCQRIYQALGSRALAIEHIGSTSVPGLPAKAVIDIDLVIADPTQEADYVPAMEAVGFQFVFREPFWYDHRFFGLEEPYANVHVFAPGCPEHLRHVAFRDWLRGCEEDRLLYASVKREAADATCQDGGTVMDYNDRKAFVIREILSRMESRRTAGLVDG